MEESNFFKGVWRLNAILIAIAGILSAFALLILVIFIARDAMQHRHSNEVVNLNTETNVKETFRLGTLENITGSTSVLIPLYSGENSSGSYSPSKNESSTRNLLFSDLRTDSTKWLFSTNEYLIYSYHLVRASNSYDTTENVLGILYYVVKLDSNGDSKLTDDDDYTIAISTPDGSNYTEIITNVQNILGYELVNKSDIAILFNKKEKNYIQHFTLSDFKIIKEAELPALNH